MNLSGRVFLTGGSGTLGRAIVRRAVEEKWDCDFTVFSRDPMKQLRMKAIYPEVRYVLGDVCDYERLKMAMTGHDIVLHLAAQKHIPYGEYDSIDTLNTNLNGTIYACEAAINCGVKQVGFISTDKSCAPHNLYGMSKAAGEKVVQEYARIQDIVSFHIVRYGNVLESTGSVIEVWKNALDRGEKIKVTDPEMTRFFMSPQDGVNAVLQCLEFASGFIFVPIMKSLEIGKLAEYGAGATEWDRIPLRPGEKIHETLISEWEMTYSFEWVYQGYYILPTSWTDKWLDESLSLPITSENAERLTKEELMELLND